MELTSEFVLDKGMEEERLENFSDVGSPAKKQHKSV